MTSLNSSLILPIVLLAFLYLTSQAFSTSGHSRDAAEHHTRTIRSKAASEKASHHSLTSLLRRRRSSKAGLWGPPSSLYSYMAESANDASSLSKRNGEDEAWIWMPAYGYVPMPTDDGNSDDKERAGDRIGNLLRYG